MSFRENLKDELNYQDIRIKELAEKTKISIGTLNHYLAEKSTEPTAENAVKIAQALGVTTEYLVTGKAPAEQQLKAPDINLSLCKKYYKLIQKIDALEPSSIKAIEHLIPELKQLHT